MRLSKSRRVASIEHITQWQRSAILLAHLRLGKRAQTVLTQLVGGSECVDVANWLAGLDTARQNRVLSRLQDEMRSPFPRGMSRIHRDWIDDALRAAGGLREHRLRNEVDDHRTAPNARSSLVYWNTLGAFAHLVSMPTGAIPKRRDVTLVDLPLFEHQTIERSIRKFGALQLAWASFALDSTTVASMGARLPREHGLRLLKDIASIRERGASDTLGPALAALARLDGLSVDDPAMTIQLAARSLAPCIATARRVNLIRQIAQRLPIWSGTAFLKHANSPDNAVLASHPRLDAFFDILYQQP